MNLTVNGRAVSATTGGTDFDPAKPAVIFLHGAGFDRTAWRLQTRWFAHHGRGVLAVDFPAQAAGLIALYEAFDSHRRNIQIAFATMYVLLALVMLLSATWLGLSFANRLVMPIRRLIAATDQVSSGNLYVQVPVHKSEGDLAHLGETFNKMTSELRLQQNRREPDRRPRRPAVESGGFGRGGRF